MELGLSDDDFWNYTPAQLDALAHAHRQRVDRDNRRTANLMALHANIHRDPKKQKAFTADDFLGTGEREPERDNSGLPNPKMSPKNQQIYMSLFFAAHKFNDERHKN